jgi:hypothetical protein
MPSPSQSDLSVPTNPLSNFAAYIATSYPGREGPVLEAFTKVYGTPDE